MPNDECRNIRACGMRFVIRASSFPVIRLLIFAIRAYQLTISPAQIFLFGPTAGCRFTPTCSQYAMDAIQAHGALAGGALAARRICRCHPWGGCGHDPVPKKAECRKPECLDKHSKFSWTEQESLLFRFAPRCSCSGFSSRRNWQCSNRNGSGSVERDQRGRPGAKPAGCRDQHRQRRFTRAGHRSRFLPSTRTRRNNRS